MIWVDLDDTTEADTQALPDFTSGMSLTRRALSELLSAEASRGEVVVASLKDLQQLPLLESLCRDPDRAVVVVLEVAHPDGPRLALAQGALEVVSEPDAESLARASELARERWRVRHRQLERLALSKEVYRLDCLSRLAGKMAHDFNNILTTILGFSDLLIEDLRGHSCEGDLLEVKRAGERGAGLTRRVLCFSRRDRPPLEVVELERLLPEWLALHTSSWPPEVVWECEFSPGLPRVWGEPGQLEVALSHLLTNAREAIRDSGKIRFKATLQQRDPGEGSFGLGPPSGRFVVLSVEDDGPGISEAQQASLFEPFYSTKPKGAGHGLGLLATLRMAKEIGGGMEVDSAPGRGTAVRLFLPVAEDHAGEQPPSG